MIRKLKYSLAFCIGLSLATPSFAQKLGTQEFGIYGGGGYSALHYKTIYHKAYVGSGTKRLDMAIGFTYNYYLSSHWSIGTGLDFSNYKNRFSMKENTDTYQSEFNGEAVEYQTTIKSYNERQKATYIGLPIKLQYETRMSENASFYISGGAKIALPIRKRFEQKKTGFESVALFPDRPAEDQLVNMGSLNRNNFKRSVALKYSFQATAETGVKWFIGDVLYFYTGVYVDYGLNNIAKTSKHHILEYNSLSTNEATPHSILSSSYTARDGQRKPYVSNKVKPLAIGLKIKLAFEL